MPLPSTSAVTLPVVAAPASPPPAAPSGHADDAPFAKLLSAEQRHAAADDSAEKPDAPRRAPTRGTPVRAPRTPAPDAATTAAPPDATLAKAEPDTPPHGDKKGDDTPVAVDPSLAGWIAALHPNATAATASVTPATAPRGEAPDAASLPVAGTDAGAPRTSAAALRADKTADRDARALPAAPLEVAESKTSSASDALRADESASHAPRFELPALHDLTAAASSAHHVAARAEPGAQPAPVVVDVPTPVSAPEFREALGVQVSVLARDGVQHAELHLNPADMGPISVQIALDGTRAQVDFGAASSATRQAIEAGLPELAAALRDAGFTLAGGGVSQHAGQPRQGDGGGFQDARGGRTARVDATADAPAARRVTVRTPQGSVDLYA